MNTLSVRHQLHLGSPAQVETLNTVLSYVQPTDREEDDRLAASLKAHGQLCPILRRGGQVVDGRRSMAALSNLSIEPWIVDLPDVSSDPENTGLLGRSFFELNACRRELNLAVRAAIADTLAGLSKGANQHSGGVSREAAARSLGVSADAVDRYRKLKSAPDVQARALRGEMSLSQAVRIAELRAVAAQSKTVVSPEGDVGSALEQLGICGTSFSAIYGDPPWDYGVSGREASSRIYPAFHYPTMTLDAIKALPIGKVSAKDAVLWLWAPNSYIERAIEVLNAWGFDFVTTAVWVKRRSVVSPGSVRPGHETLIVGKRGAGLPFAGSAMPSVFIDDEAVTVHSKKPAHFVRELERLYPEAGKVELFGRSQRNGWLVLGNQVGVVAPTGTKAANDDICVSVSPPASRSDLPAARNVETPRREKKKKGAEVQIRGGRGSTDKAGSKRDPSARSNASKVKKA